MLEAYKAAWPWSGFHRHITIRQIYENSKNYGTPRQVSGEVSREGLEAQCTRGSRWVPDAGALLSVHSTTTHPAPLVQLSRETVRRHKVTKTTSQRDNTRQICYITEKVQEITLVCSQANQPFPRPGLGQQPCVILQNRFQVMQSLHQFTCPCPSMPASLPWGLHHHAAIKVWKK